jgi:hypothetical protein
MDIILHIDKITNRSFLLVFLSLLVGSQAFPAFTGNCASGNPLGGSHLKASSKGPLSKYGLQLKIGSTVIMEGKTSTILSGKTLPISLISTSGKQFRGFQIRISKPGIKDTSKYFASSTDSAVQVDKYCTSIGIGGLSHNSKRDKSKIEAIFKPPSTSIVGLKLEVFVVVSNGPSVWYRSEFSVNIKSATPTISPMAPVPSKKPVKVPTASPGVPTKFKPPTRSPTKKKTSALPPALKTSPPVIFNDDGLGDDNEESNDDDNDGEDDDEENNDDDGEDDDEGNNDDDGEYDDDYENSDNDDDEDDDTTFWRR